VLVVVARERIALPFSGISTAREARTVFMFYSILIDSMRVAGQFAGAINNKELMKK